MAIGAGTVLMPVQIGLTGIWVFIVAFIIAYPATYIVQDIYLKTLSESETCNDYTDIISHYLGKKLGRISWRHLFSDDYSRHIYLFLIRGFDSASYIKTFGLTEADLSQSIIYKVAILPCWSPLLPGRKAAVQNLRPDGGGQSGYHHRIWFCDGSALELR